MGYYHTIVDEMTIDGLIVHGLIISLGRNLEGYVTAYA